ncbi:MAG TPA: hypothetical protein VFY44_05185 [Thermoleophilaceae bacterium]|nr:hypothetical protein [Thermoleophilaceae bacterium]
MRGIRGLLTAALAVAALTVCPGAAEAAGWSAPAVAAPDGSPAAVGLDDAGTITVLYFDSDRRPFLASRGPTAGRFGAPVPVGPPGAMAQLAVAPSGRVVVMYSESACPCNATSKLFYRAGPSAATLSAPRLLTGNAHFLPTLSIAANGYAIAAWASSDAVEVATMPPGQGFGAPQQLVKADAATGGGIDFSTSVEAAVNDRGDALVAWDGGKNVQTLDASYRPAGAAFSPPERLTGEGGYPFTVAMHPAAVGTVRYAARGGAAVRSRGPLGGFTEPAPIGGGPFGDLVVSPAGPQAAIWGDQDESRNWRDPGSWRRYVATRRPDGTFAGPRPLTGVVSAEPPAAGLDSLGNLFVAWGEGDLGKGRIRAMTMNRFDPTPADITPPADGGYGVPPGAMAVNAEGGVAEAYGGVPSWVPGGGVGVLVLERKPDQVAPGLAVRPAARRLGRVAVRVRCSEACRARATVNSAARGPRARRSRSTRSRPVTLRRGARGRLTLAVPRSERRRLARTLRRRGRVKVTLVVRVEDAAGNHRSVRRRLSARRLLR